MFFKYTLKRIIFSVALALIVLLLPVVPGTFSGPVEQAPDIALEPGLRLLSTITEKSESGLTASFNNDQQMIRDYTVSAEKMAAVALNPAAVIPGAFSPNDRIIVEVSEGKYYLVIVEEAFTDPEATIVSGTVEESPLGFFHLTITGGQAMAVLRVPEENKVYHIVYSNTGQYQLFEFAITDFERYKDDSLPLRIPPEVRPASPAEKEEPELVSSAIGLKTAGSPGPNDPATIDVMVVYTPAARAWAGGTAGVNNVINLAMLRAQDALTNSNTGITLRLVHSVEVSYTEVNIGKSLNDITYNRVGNVHALRDAYGADLVAFFPRHNGGGIAWLGWFNGFGQAQYGYSASCITGVAGSYLAIHEMGHNLGAHHHKLQNFQPGPHPRYSYAAGWRFEHGGTLFNTLMSYSHSSFFSNPSDPYRNRTSIEVGYFSTPRLTFPGGSVVLGHATNGNNVRILRETKHGVAAFRPTAGPSYTLTVNSTNPVSGLVITSSSGQNGTTPYSLQVLQNSNATLTAPEYHGSGTNRKRFDHWSGASTSTNRTITLTMDANRTFSANYVDDPAPVITLGDAVDAPHLTWTTDGNADWFGQSDTTRDSIDAAQSGPITHNQETWMQTTVTGPGTLSFWWRVSSELFFDCLKFYINDELQTECISGNVDWQQKTYTLSPGTNTLKWRYEKDFSVSRGSDTGWVDQVVWTPGTTGAPTLTSLTPASVTRGQTVAVTIAGTNLTGASTVNFDNGITVNNFTVNSATRVTANITVAADATTGARNVSVTTLSGTGTLTGGFTVNAASTTGSIQARIIPLAARRAGAQWRLTTGPDTTWKDHNVTIRNLPAGTYTIRFRNISGWTKPADIRVTIGAGNNIVRRGVYARPGAAGFIRVSINPVDARTAGAQWRLTTGPDTGWKDHNVTIRNLPAGTYTIRFKNLSGWTRPADIRVTLGSGDNPVRAVIYARTVTTWYNPGHY